MRGAQQLAKTQVRAASPTSLIIALGPTTELDLDGLAPWVRELVSWLGPGESRPTLVGLICSAPPGLLDDTRSELDHGSVIPVRWALNSIVRHALLPLAELSLVNGQPVIPELVATLVAVLGDPRLGPAERHEVEFVLADSKILDAELAAECAGLD